jgi:hypothetical protein
MADTYTAGGYTFASDDVGGTHTPRYKIQWGADGTVNDASATNPVPFTSIPITSGGCSVHKSIDLDESEEEVKATAGQVYGFLFSNHATSSRFLKFYNDTAANVIVGTTTPTLTFTLPGNASDDVSGVIAFPFPIAFSTAICVAATTGIADNDTGAPSANDVSITVLYK